MMADNYRERDGLVGGTQNPWNSHATFTLWEQGADFQDGDADDSNDVVDARAARTTSGSLSLDKLAPVADYNQ